MRIQAADAAIQQVQEDMLALIASRAAAPGAAAQAPHPGGMQDKPAAAAPAGPVQTHHAVREINEAMKALSTSLEFRVDEESGRTVVKVIDGVSGDVLRQIPSEATLQIAHSLDRLVGHLVSHRI